MNKLRSIRRAGTAGPLLISILFALLLIALVSGVARSQETSIDQPLEALQRFKQAIDAGDVATMCVLMAEPDSSGPLKKENYEKTRASLEGLVTFWQGRSFAYGSPSIDQSGKIPSASVRVVISQLRQTAQFSLLRFGDVWYVRDIEVYFQ